MHTVKLYYSRFLKSRLAKDAGVYTTFTVLDRAVPFILLPVITRFLSPDEYGVYVTFQTLLSFFVPFLSLGTDASIIISYFKLSYEKFKEYFFNSFVIFLSLSAIVFVVFYFLSSQISDVVKFPSQWLMWVFAGCFFQYINDLNANLWQSFRKPHRYGVFKISYTILKNGLNLYFVISLGLSWQGLIYSQIITAVIFCSVSLVIFLRREYFNFDFNASFMKDSLRYGIPLSLHNLGAWAADLASRLILNSMVGIAATGEFGAGATLGMIVSLIQDSFNRAFAPYLFEQLKNPTLGIKKSLVKKTYLYYIVIFIVAAIVGIAGSLAASTILGEKYKNSQQFIIWISFAYAFTGLYKMHVNYIFYEKKSKLLMLITLISGAVNILLCFWLIETNGAIGAAQAFLLSNAVSYAVTFYIANRLVPMPWNVFKLAG
ncbi:MAG: oligosaccharide flippase family protein [Ignavibacteria bacterium]|nr:oligosaccharide flippase family protein [Ignavibacteria bacterium]